MRRVAMALSLAVLGVLLLVPVAMASDDPTGGQGLYGESNDRVVTYIAFVVIAAVPLFVWLMSLLQGRLEKRKQARKAAAKAAEGSADPRGGW